MHRRTFLAAALALPALSSVRAEGRPPAASPHPYVPYGVPANAKIVSAHQWVTVTYHNSLNVARGWTERIELIDGRGESDSLIPGCRVVVDHWRRDEPPTLRHPRIPAEGRPWPAHVEKRGRRA